MVPFEEAVFPLIAILRGIKPDEVADVVEVLAEGELQIIEVTMNSPKPLESIKIAMEKSDGMLIGAGTVLTVEEVDQVADLGAGLIVSPNCNPDVIRRTKERGLTSVPGCATSTEIFAALEAGADVIKLYPSALVTPDVVKAYVPVLPRDLKLMVTGGIPLDLMHDYRVAGVYGFGLGSQLYKPGKSLEDIASALRVSIHAFQNA